MNQRKSLFIIAFTCFIFFSSEAYSQSKKEQILILGNKVDSLTKALLTERQLFEKSQKKTKGIINNYRKQLDSVVYDYKILNIRNENLTLSNIQKQNTIDLVRDSIVALNVLLNCEKQLEDLLPTDPWLGQKIIFQSKISQVSVGDFSVVYFELLDVNKDSGPIITIDDFKWKLQGYFKNMNNIIDIKEGDFYQVTLQRMEYDESAPIEGSDWMLVEMTKVNR